MLKAFRWLGVCFFSVMVGGQTYADNLPTQRVSGGGATDVRWATAEAQSVRVDFDGTDFGSPSISTYVPLNAIDGDSIADTLFMLAGSTDNGSSLIPKVDAEAMLLVSGMGSWFTAGAAGDVGATGNFEILSDPLNPSVTSGWLTATLEASNLSGPNTFSVGGAGITLPGAAVGLGSAAGNGGAPTTTLTIDGVVVHEVVGGTFAIQVESLVAVGDVIQMGAAQDAGGGVQETTTVSASGCNGHSNVSFEVDGVLPSNPNVIRVKKLIWNETTEEYDVGATLWEYEPE